MTNELKAKLTTGQAVFSKDEVKEVMWEYLKFTVNQYETGNVRQVLSIGVDDYLKSLKPAPLLITEDRVSVYDKETRIFLVNTDTYLRTDGNLHTCVGSVSDWKYFSTEEARDIYFNENKPKFSVRERREEIEGIIKYVNAFCVRKDDYNAKEIIRNIDDKLNQLIESKK